MSTFVQIISGNVFGWGQGRGSADELFAAVHVVLQGGRQWVRRPICLRKQLAEMTVWESKVCKRKQRSETETRRRTIDGCSLNYRCKFCSLLEMTSGSDSARKFGGRMNLRTERLTHSNVSISTELLLLFWNLFLTLKRSQIQCCGMLIILGSYKKVEKSKSHQYWPLSSSPCSDSSASARCSHREERSSASSEEKTFQSFGWTMLSISSHQR